MLIELYYISGNMESFDTTALAFGDDETGILIDDAYVDFSHPDEAGITMDRRYFCERGVGTDGRGGEEHGPVSIAEELLVVPPEALGCVGAVVVDGSVVLVRELDKWGNPSGWANFAEESVRRLMRDSLRSAFGEVAGRDETLDDESA